MIDVVDDMGRHLVLTAPAVRVVSLVPSLTEAVCALGAAAALVGVTRYCTEPAAALASVPRVGGTKNPDIERIVALRPDLVIVNAEENRREDFERLDAARLQVFVSFSHHARDVADLMVRLGTLVGARAAGERLAVEVQAALAAVATARPAVPLRVFCPIWKNPWMSFNADTYPDDMLREAGGLNVCGGLAQRFATVDLADVARADPEIVLLPDEPYVFSARDLADLEPLRETAALRGGRVHFIDGKALSWYGPRTAGGLLALQRTLLGGQRDS